MYVASDGEAGEHRDVWGPNRDLEPAGMPSQVRDRLVAGSKTDPWASQACDSEEKE